MQHKEFANHYPRMVHRKVPIPSTGRSYGDIFRVTKKYQKCSWEYFASIQKWFGYLELTGSTIVLHKWQQLNKPMVLSIHKSLQSKTINYDKVDRPNGLMYHLTLLFELDSQCKEYHEESKLWLSNAKLNSSVIISHSIRFWNPD